MLLNKFYFIFYFFIFSNLLFSQKDKLEKGKVMYNLYYKYEYIKEKSLRDRKFKHNDIERIILNLKNYRQFKVSEIGKSFENRTIYAIEVGKGEKKVLLWSQMHGDEPTATAAIFDLFNYFLDPEMDYFKETILTNLKMVFIPMLNPDGAERFQRRNAQNIDINRDAIREQTPEGRLLKNYAKEFKPLFGFNLHDQNPRYSVGQSNKRAALSFLAPSFNYQKDINEVRKNAIGVIVQMNRMLQPFISGHIAKYPDDYEPRAFGDYFQSQGISTILIESGGWNDDLEKQFIRKLNFLALIAALECIAKGYYDILPLEEYERIPFNSTSLFDILIKNANVILNNYRYKIDIGINIDDTYKENKNFIYGYIEDLGDLSLLFGAVEYDFSNLFIEPLKFYEFEINDLEKWKSLDHESLLRQGYGFVLIDKNLVSKIEGDGINIVVGEQSSFEIAKGSNASFAIKDKSGNIIGCFLNGFFSDFRINNVKLKGSFFDKYKLNLNSK